jgi:hypothetical protein
MLLVVLLQERRKTCCALHWRFAMLAVLLVQLRFSSAIAAARDGFSKFL